MKNASKVILLLAIAFSISVPKDSIAQNTDRIPHITARMPEMPQVDIGDFSAIKGTRIPTHKGKIDVIVSGRRTTASYWDGPTSCNIAFLNEFGLPIPDRGSWHNMHSGPTSSSIIRYELDHAWAKINLDLKVSDIRKSSFPVVVRMGAQQGNSLFLLGPDFFLPGKVINDWTHNQLIYTK